MVVLVNRAKMTTSTTGTGTITLGSATSGFQTFAAAGVSNGNSIRYVIEDGNAWEIGSGTYTSSGTALSRSPSQSSGGGGAITLSGSAVVFVSAIASDIQTTLASLGLSASATELNYVDGVTSAIQTQLNTKASTGKSIAMAMVFG